MEHNGIPKRLFKYFAPSRIESLANQLFRYSPLGAFNDPFEGRPEIIGLAPREAALSAFEEALPEELEKAYAKAPPQLRAVFSPQQWQEFALPQIRSRSDDFMAMLGAASKEFLPTLPQRFDKLIGVFCLCEVPDSLLMWAHYGMSHTGFILEFDATHPYFNARRSDKDEFCHLRRVLYRDTRPSANLVELDGAEMFLVKSSHWAYEREWRILRPISHAHSTIEISGETIHLFKVPSDAIRAVIFGARASNGLVEQARDTIAKATDLSHVELLKCTPNASHFALHVQRVAT